MAGTQNMLHLFSTDLSYTHSKSFRETVQILATKLNVGRLFVIAEEAAVPVYMQ